MDLTKHPCLPCVLGTHWECSRKKEYNCCCQLTGPSLVENKRGGTNKEDNEVTDPKSTGRKRAAILFPIEEGMTCEWEGLKFAGGGLYPIVGCTGNPATNRHHGPDKNTLNNDKGNVHRICARCHNRWHTRNDPVYEKFLVTEKWLRHDSESKATPEEILKSEVYWKSNQQEKIKDVEH
jgi:hypothetical protein